MHEKKLRVKKPWQNTHKHSHIRTQYNKICSYSAWKWRIRSLSVSNSISLMTTDGWILFITSTSIRFRTFILHLLKSPFISFVRLLTNSFKLSVCASFVFVPPVLSLSLLFYPVLSSLTLLCFSLSLPLIDALKKHFFRALLMYVECICVFLSFDSQRTRISSIIEHLLRISKIATMKMLLTFEMRSKWQFQNKFAYSICPFDFVVVLSSLVL